MITEGIFFSLIVGAYGYTYLTRDTKSASLEDLHRMEDRLERRIDMLYEHSLNRPMPLAKNGEKAR